MTTFEQWVGTLLELLVSDDEEACASVVRGLGGSCRAAVVLPEADLSVAEAFRYARLLRELGNRGGARELTRAALRAALGERSVAVGQRPVAA